MKLIGAAAVFISCAYAGFSVSDRLKKRGLYLRNIVIALDLLETEISFGGSRIKQAFARIDAASDTRGLFNAAAGKVEELGIKKAWKEAVEEKRDELRFTESDAEELMSLGERLGMTDTENQIKNIRYVKKRLEARADEAEGEYERMGRLYRSGGALIGLFLILLLI